MKTKLTLSIEERLIQKAKRLASERGTSVSALVERYFSVLEGEPDAGHQENTAFTRALRGALSDSDVTEEDYYRHLEEKHE